MISRRSTAALPGLVVWLALAALVAAAAPPPAGAPPVGPAPAAPAAKAPAPAEAAAGTADEAIDEAEAGSSKQPTVFELLDQGGYIMYPIYLLSIVAMAFALERGISLRRGRILPRAFVANLRDLLGARPIDSEKILTYCQANPSPISRVFQVAVKRLRRPLPEIEKAIEDAGAREVRLLRRNCRVLSGVAYIAPLLGLLGTVMGMIKCFSQVSTGEALGRAERLAGGIYQALVTTAGGLTVAIPAAVLYLMFMAKIEKLVSEMDDLSIEFVESVADETAK
ncbi:MAG: MotA/TolQ/ExbB proton channel family protein [Planctomycetes bacterium]|nr:MotA/TolQ/ExbB proton channel family protein [Planctomycetota bacterium]